VCNLGSRDDVVKVIHLFISAIRAIAAIIRIIATTILTLIQIGERTQIQGQLIWPVSLRPINRTVKRPEKLIPLEDEEELLDID
jgi:hypothetical protein